MKSLEHHWYQRSIIPVLLIPLSWIFSFIVAVRRRLYRAGIFKVSKPPVPVIVVGNITVGGTGKTPMVIWLVNLLKSRGYKPGIISRGYGGKAKHWPQQVRPDSDSAMVGDEPVLMAKRCRCPVAVSPDRVEAANAIFEHTNCDIIVSDDGMQHYALDRDIEIIVIDGVRRFGNGLPLPAGPLRESTSRLREADFVVVNSGGVIRNEFPMSVVPLQLVNVRDESQVMALEELRQMEVHAIAGIGNNERFFSQLEQLGIRIRRHGYPDHYKFSSKDVSFDDDLPVIMTEKDAVKCRRFANNRCWCLTIDAQLDFRFKERILASIQKISNQKTLNPEVTHGQKIT
ncbi:MAG: tetraacyldisaccharide 4'-kinase [Gammaproteobacteria bacterium]